MKEKTLPVKIAYVDEDPDDSKYIDCLVEEFQKYWAAKQAGIETI